MNDAPEKELSKDERMLLGLEILECVRAPGERLTYEHIAAYAGCTHMTIRQIEFKALEKLKRAMKKQGLGSMAQV